MFLKISWIVIAVLLFASPALAAKKVALLIGNAEYSGSAARLKNPANDVAAMETTLSKVGFDVFTFTNLTRIGMSKALRDFEKAASGADIGLIFYSGHGIEVSGTNYLIPVDARLETDRDAKYEAIDLEDVLAALSSTKLLKLVLLDACRDNPFLNTMKGSTKGNRGKGLARVDGLDNETNLLIGYATAPRETAQDGDGVNSPFTKALIEHLVEPGVEVQTAFRAVAKAVYQETNGEQRPYSTGSLFETVMLGPEKTAQSTPALSSSLDPCGNAAAHWESIKDRKNAVLFREHLARFGNCDFSSVAQIELNALEAAAHEAVTSDKNKSDGDTQQTETAALPSAAIIEEQNMALLRSLQVELNRVGCYDKPVDGEWGRASERALASFNTSTNNTFDPKEPTTAALNAIKSLNGRVCPLTSLADEGKISSELLTITSTGGRKHQFTVELAVTFAQREQGLKSRKTMGRDAGMLFDFGESRPVKMWMKNTDLALDMLFIDKNGSIHRIHRNAVPYSRDIISSNGSVMYVLELNGGTTAALGIHEGDRVFSRQIGNVD